MTRLEIRMLAEELYKLMVKNGKMVFQEVLESKDEFISIDKASELLGYSKSWMYKHKDEFPYTRIDRKLMFSRKGIEKILMR